MYVDIHGVCQWSSSIHRTCNGNQYIFFMEVESSDGVLIAGAHWLHYKVYNWNGAFTRRDRHAHPKAGNPLSRSVGDRLAIIASSSADLSPFNCRHRCDGTAIHVASYTCTYASVHHREFVAHARKKEATQSFALALTLGFRFFWRHVACWNDQMKRSPDQMKRSDWMILRSTIAGDLRENQTGLIFAQAIASSECCRWNGSFWSQTYCNDIAALDPAATLILTLNQQLVWIHTLRSVIQFLCHHKRSASIYICIGVPRNTKRGPV
jgi:hypothetical protein